MKLKNTGVRGMSVGSVWSAPGEVIEVSDETDLSKVDGAFVVVGKKLKEPLKANLKEG